MESPNFEFYFNPINLSDRYLILTKFKKEIPINKEDFIEEIDGYKVYQGETPDEFYFVNEQKNFYGLGQKTD